MKKDLTTIQSIDATLTERSPHQLLLELNNTATDYPRHLCIHELFSAQVAQNPDRIAVVCPTGQLTYQELNCRANQIAHYLQDLGVKPEVMVGICVERSVATIVGLLGILKAGGAYVPLDPTYPPARRSFMLADARVEVLLTEQQFSVDFADSGAKAICLDTDWESIDRYSPANLPSNATADNLAYVIYTSGSTGTPKGVAVTHQAVNRLVINTNYVQLEPIDRIAQAANVSFDAATFEIWGALLHGATLVIVPQQVVLAPQQFADYIQTHKISCLFLTTALFNQIASTVPQAFSNLRYLLFGGEAVDPQSVAAVLKNGAPQRLLHVYGPTESTTFACWYLVREIPAGATNIPIGRPISNTQVYILDSNCQPVAIGTTGELYIGGDGLARGYLHRPELTEAKFSPNPFSQEQGARLYKTGDLARYLPDGNIEFLGRSDRQVKLRGFRIELAEIETLLSQHADVRQAVVVVREDRPGDRRLVAYIVPNQQVEAIASQLDCYLQAQLPPYMVPGAWVLLESLPLTANGKVDRQNLPAPDRSRPDLAAPFVAPRHPIEEKLAAIWSELLGVDRIGVNDRFFDLGGHSLIATQTIARIRTVFQVELSSELLFNSPTIASLAAAIALAQPLDRQSIDSRPERLRQRLHPIARQGLLPVFATQERIYFIQQLAPESNAYQFQATLQFTGNLQVHVLQQCLNEIVSRHEIFRTTYTAVDGRLFQIVQPHQPIDFTTIDLQHLPESEREPETHRLIAAAVQQPLNPEQLPLIRWVLLKQSDRSHRLLHIEHHLAHDGWSFNLFLDELVKLYQAFAVGNPSPLTPPPIQFADFAQWQREWLNSEAAAAQLTYWQQQLAGSVPLLELPADRPRPSEPTYQGDSIRIELPIDLCESLRSLSRREDVTLFMTMLAAFLVLLHRYTGQDDLSIGTAVANRRMQEVEKLIGPLVNNLVLRTDLAGNPTFRELLDRVRQVNLAAYAHQDLPFDRVVEAIDPIRNLSYNPLFQVMFSFHDSAMPALSLPGLEIDLHEPIGNKSAKFDLDLLVIPRSEQRVQHGNHTGSQGITLVLEYNSDLFDAATIERTIAQYQLLLAGIVANPEQRIWSLPLLTQSEQQSIAQWQQTSCVDRPPACFPQLFAAQVELTPTAIAIEQAGQQLTYRELRDRVNQLAHYLQSLGVKPETLVGICVERSLETIVGLLGILTAGGAYVPLDPEYPPARIADILADTQLQTILTQAKFQDRLPPDYAGNIICLDADWLAIDRYPTTTPISDIELQHLAYIIYTSGSTGKPKGVAIEHRSLTNFALTAIHEYGIKSSDRLLQFASICFDASIEEIFPGLLVGATVVLRTEAMLHSSDEFWRCCRAWQLTVLDLPTAYWHQLVAELQPEDARIPASLRTVIIGGEAAQLERVQQWHRSVVHLPVAPQLFNSYGPTETTVIATVHRFDPAAAHEISIGRPIANTQVYILDRDLQPVPIGIPGELHLGGAGVARGYWQRPELTATKFIPHPTIEPPSADRLYKTGDLARFRANGNIEYLGRLDEQVKIRGFRVELGEIETVLRQHPQVVQAVVIAREDIPGSKRLVAYIVPQQPQPSIDELRQFLNQKLPSYLVPTAFVLLAALPLTPNRKIDFRALPAPDLSPSDADRGVDPRNSIEARLVKIWSEILRLERVGIHDNYFALGGDSILSIQLISRANQAGIHIAPKQLFRYQTIAELAAVAGSDLPIAANQGVVTGAVALTPIQQWLFAQKLPAIEYFNQSVLLEVPPDLQLSQLQQVVNYLFIHHDALRLRFDRAGSEWTQFNATDEAPVPFSVIDLSHLEPAAQQTAIETADAQLQASLNLATGPIAQVALFQLGSDRSGRLLLVIHHLAVDAVSWRILLEDLAMGYQQICRGEAIQFPPKTTSWQDWSDRLSGYARSKAIAELDYWLSQASFPVAALPVDDPEQQADRRIATTAAVSLTLDAEHTRALLQAVPVAYNTQINDVLLTAILQGFAGWTSASSLLIDLEGHGREDLFEDVDLSRTVGWFTTLYPLHLQLTANDNPGAALKSVKEQLRRIPNRGIGYGALRYLAKNADIRAKLQSLPSAQVSFNYLGQFDRVLSASEVLGLVREFKAAQSDANQRSHLLGISGLIRAGKLEMTWTYSEKIHHRATIASLAQSCMDALTTTIAHCQSQTDHSYTPTDFSAAKLNQQQLDKFLAKINKKVT